MNVERRNAFGECGRSKLHYGKREDRRNEQRKGEKENKIYLALCVERESK